MTDKKPEISEMSASEIAMRKFLKQLGVTTHQKLDAALQARLKDGTADAGERLSVSAQIAIPELGFTHMRYRLN